jgi:hypothetical protein
LGFLIEGIFLLLLLLLITSIISLFFFLGEVDTTFSLSPEASVSYQISTLAVLPSLAGAANWLLKAWDFGFEGCGALGLTIVDSFEVDGFVLAWARSYGLFFAFGFRSDAGAIEWGAAGLRDV